MKKIALLGVLVTALAACICLTGCDEEYNVPTKTGGGGKSFSSLMMSLISKKYSSKFSVKQKFLVGC